MRAFYGWLAPVVFALIFVSGGALAQKPDPGRDTPKILSEVMALKIGKLYAERQVFEQALLKLAAQQESIRSQTQLTRGEYDKKETELATVIATAAHEAGLDLKEGWVPAPEERRWVKPESK